MEKDLVLKKKTSRCCERKDPLDEVKGRLSNNVEICLTERSLVGS